MKLQLKRTPGIYLVGFMGSGKTTIGKRLAGHLGWSFADLDADIEAQTGMSISRLFEQQGEAAFRAAEAIALEHRIKQVKQCKPLVLALGGGAFAQAANRASITGNGFSIWLDVPFEVIERRVAGFAHRPLARDPEKFRELFDARLPAYALADFKISAASDDDGENVQAILAEGWFE